MMFRPSLRLTVMVWVAVACSSLRPGLPAAEESASQSPPAAKAPTRESPASREIVSAADSIMTAEQIEEALDRPINVSFRDDRLTDCLDFLGELLKIQVHLDVSKLSEEGISPDTPIYLQMNAIRAHQVLMTILEPLTLDYVVWDGLLQITTVAAAEEIVDTRVYDVSELLVERDENSFKQTIVNTLAPGTWAEVGGMGMISLNANIMVVLQTQRVHRKLRKFLEEMRAADKLAASKPVARELTLRTYTVGDQPAEQIARILQELVSPETWQPAGGKGEIRAAGNTLFIRQTPAVHRAIERLVAPFQPTQSVIRKRRNGG